MTGKVLTVAMTHQCSGLVGNQMPNKKANGLFFGYNVNGMVYIQQKT